MHRKLAIKLIWMLYLVRVTEAQLNCPADWLADDYL